MTADEAFLIFANAVLQRVLALATSGGVPNVTQAALIFPDGGGSRVITYNTTAYWVLFQTINDGALASMQEAADAVRIHLDQGVLAQPVMSDSNGTIQDPTFEQQVQALVGHLLAPVRDAVERVNTLDVRPEQLLESYWRHRDQLTATQTPSEILVPLLNFRMTGGPVRIIESLEVAAFTGQDKTNVWNSMLSVDEQMPLRQFEQTQFKLFGSFISPRTQPASDNQFLTLVRDVVTAFRLVKPGDVGAPAVFRRITNGLFTRWSSLSFLDDLRVRPMYRAADYAFDSVEASVVTDVIDKLQRIRRSHDIHGLEIGLRRFNQSYTRTKIPLARTWRRVISRDRATGTGQGPT